MLIAQFSDIHAAADNDNLSRLDRALAWLDRIAPDALVLTGDLIDNGEIEGYSAIAARLATRPYPAFIRCAVKPRPSGRGYKARFSD